MKTQVLELYNSPCHCNYDPRGCCGIFDEIKDGVIVCNECGMTLIELLKPMDHY